MLSDREAILLLEKQLAGNDFAQWRKMIGEDSDALQRLLAQQAMERVLQIFYENSAHENALVDEMIADSYQEDFATEIPLTANFSGATKKSQAAQKWIVCSAVSVGILLAAIGIYFQSRSDFGRSAESRISKNSAPLTASDAAAEPAQTEKKRDWFWRPFSSKSPWNQPLDPHVEYVPCSFGDEDVSTIAVRRFVVSEKFSAKMQAIFCRGNLRAQLRLPSALDVTQFDEEPLCVIDLARKKVWVLQKLRAKNGAIDAGEVSADALRENGFDPLNANGDLVNCSALGGIVRGNELESGIPHALAICVDFNALRGSEELLSGEEPLRIGSRIAIPRNVNLQQLGLNSFSPKILQIAKTLQRYGAYVVGSCDHSQVKFYFDQTVDFPPGLNRALNKLILQTALVEPAAHEDGH